MITLLKECAECIRSLPNNELSEILLDKIRLELARNDGYAVVSTVSRYDIVSAGYDANAVSDDELDRIAESMHEDHTEYGGYWVALKDACDDLKIPRTLSKMPIHSTGVR